MIKSITVTNFVGQVLTLNLSDSEPTSGLIVSKIDGLGPAKGNINTTDVSTNDGSIYNSSRLSQRNIVIDLLFVKPNTTNTKSNIVEDARLNTYKYFPIKKQVMLTIETDRRMAYTYGYVESNEPNIFSKDSGATISIICPDPYFYSFYGRTKTSFAGLASDFYFPFYGVTGAYHEHSHDTDFCYLGVFGRITNIRARDIYYSGDSEVGVEIKANAIGNVSNIVLYNVDTREAMRIDTSKLAELIANVNPPAEGEEIPEGVISGDEITISTVRGNKYATLLRNGHTYNILNCLDRNSSWFQLSEGDNVFAYEAEEGASYLQISITNDVIYEGV